MTELIENAIHDEISFKEIFKKVNPILKYIKSRWWKIFIIGLLGFFLAGLYAYTRPINYTAELSFLVEEGRTSGGGLSSLAGQFGLDVSGAGGATLFSGDNILMFFKSTSLTKETLLTPYSTYGNYSLADKYADVMGLKEKWKTSDKVSQNITFPANKKIFTRLEDSLLNTIISVILKKDLKVERPEKKSTFIIVTVSLRDELLASLFCERLVQKATDRYVLSKISRQKINVDRLAKRADSLERVLNNRTFSTASAQQEILDLNPAAKTETVDAEVKTRDKMMLTQIYGEVIKNLEISKVQLSQETPTIQIVDTPNLPLPKTNKQIILFALAGGIVFSFLSIFFFIIKKMLQ